MSALYYLLHRENGEDVVKRRARRRKLLMLRLTISKCLLITAVVSILVTIINTQLMLTRVYPMCSKVASILKLSVSGLTGLLILFIWIYNYVQLEIYRNIRNIRSIFMALQVNPQRTLLTLVETLAALPHPLPFCYGYEDSSDHIISEHVELGLNITTVANYTVSNYTVANYTVSNYTDTNGTTTPSPHPLQILKLNEIDSVLSILMFIRLYQICRFSVLHSQLFRTMLSYSLGALAHTKYNFSFIFKSYMAIYKGYFLGSLAFTFTLIAAWCMYISDSKIYRYQDSLWIVGITFFTVGYGDMSPGNKCSQIVAVLTGFSGMFFMGISVTVLSRYLQLTYDEYCMLSMFIEMDTQKTLQQASARIIQAAWLQHKSKNANMLQRLRSQQHLIAVLHQKKRMQTLRVTSRERREKQVPLYDMKEQMKKLTIRTEYVFEREERIVETVKATKERLQTMHDKLLVLIKLLQKDKRLASVDLDATTQPKKKPQKKSR